jgi:hypothetical protein
VTEPLWYPPTIDCPGIGVRVIVSWNGRELAAARVADKAGHYAGWVTFADKKFVALPPPREADRWGDEPSAWRPERPDLWKAALPEPLASCAPRMWSSRMTFGAVDDAESADLAREMEADRADARASSRREAAEEVAPPKQWWLDPSLITYSPPGAISPHEAEGRLMRAFIAERCEHMARPTGRTFADVLAAMSKTVPTERADATESLIIRSSATGRDKDDMLIALAWWDALGGREAAVLYHRSLEPPKSWRAIAESIGRSHEATRTLHAAAIIELTRIANGGATNRTRAKAGQLAAVCAANRRHRLESRG